MQKRIRVVKPRHSTSKSGLEISRRATELSQHGKAFIGLETRLPPHQATTVDPKIQRRLQRPSTRKTAPNDFFYGHPSGTWAGWRIAGH